MSNDVSGRRRQSRGTPTGGQFATEARCEPPLSLAAPVTALTSDQVRSAFVGGNAAREATFDRLVSEHEAQSIDSALTAFANAVDVEAIAQDWSDRPGDREAMQQAAHDAVSAIVQSARDAVPARRVSSDSTFGDLRAAVVDADAGAGAAFRRWGNVVGHRAQARALTDFANGIDLDAIAGAAADQSGIRDAHWAAGNAASAVQMAAYDAAAAARRMAEAEEEGR